MLNGVGGGNHTGDTTFESGCSFTMNGGSASGTGTGGLGGSFAVTTEGDTTLYATSIVALGGSAPSGTGGNGGSVNVLSDASNGGIGGNIVTTAGTFVNVSGGNGGVLGGDALNNGVVGTVTAPVCMSFSAGDGDITLAGTFIGKGGSINGNGGDNQQLTTGTIDDTAATGDFSGSGTGNDGDSIP